MKCTTQKNIRPYSAMDLGEARNARGQDAESMSEDMARWRAELGEDFEQPERKGLDDLTEEEEAAVEWRTGKRPAYVLANHVFLEGKSQRHAKGELKRSFLYLSLYSRSF